MTRLAWYGLLQLALAAVVLGAGLSCFIRLTADGWAVVAFVALITLALVVRKVDRIISKEN